MPNPFTLFAFPSTGQSARRTMPDRLAEVTNVKDISGVDPTGVASSTAAIQAVIDANATGNYGTFYFPPGSYLIGSPGIKFNRVGDISIRFTGEGRASNITANFGGFVFERSANPAPAALDVGPIVFENLSIFNSNAAGGCIRVGSVRGVLVRNCIWGGYQGVWLCGSTFDACQGFTIENCPVVGTNGIQDHACNQIVVGGAGSINACDLTGCVGTSVRIFGRGCGIRDTRFEVNRTAITVGKFPDDTDDTNCGNFHWMGGSTESNSLTLNLQNCTNFFVAGTGAAGGSSPWHTAAVAGPLTITGSTSGATANIDSNGIDAFGNFHVTSSTGTWVFERFTGTGVPLGVILGSTITGPGNYFAFQNPQNNTYIGPNCSNGVFAGYGSGAFSYQESTYISDTTNRAGIVFIGCDANTASTSFAAQGTEWRIPTTAHTAEFINCTATHLNNPVAGPSPVYLFSGLPSAPREGDVYAISNAHTATGAWGEQVSDTGGTTVGFAITRYNGTIWTLEAK